MQEDEEVFKIFLEETEELLVSAQKALDLLILKFKPNLKAEFKRVLHTIKGNARTVNQKKLADHAHEFEQMIDRSSETTEEAKRWQKPLDDLQRIVDEIKQPALLEVEAAIKEDPNITKVSLHVPIEMIEKLADLAGVAAISRVAIGQRFKHFGNVAFDLMTGLHRLMDHIKQLEQENEANSQKLINAISPKNIGKGENIDPLQLERYSFFEYLARAFSETAHMLHGSYEEFRSSLNASHEILEQQAQATQELEARLSQTRMVSFNTIIHRLQRIVRQISEELHKEIYLVTENIDTEVDRGVLEKLVPALDHLIRNAIDHGIEEQEKRKALGKKEKGCICLSLSRKTAELRLVLSDDGAGINTKKVHQLAIEKGLVSEDLELSEEEIMPFIMHPGLTTKEVVTQISGRGIGMDVVASDIKALGGSIHIQSKRDQGTSFTIILPLNLSLTQVLLFKLQHDHYAINLANISGVARFPQHQITQALNNNEPMLYLKDHYQVHYLSEIFGYHSFAGVAKEIVPALLLTTNTQKFCLVIDHVIGSREIVLKSLGNQLREVPGISGACVLEEGHLVLVLDGLMIPQLIQHHKDRTSLMLNKVLKKMTVLIVDDSLTVRRVTQKILERYEFQSLMAKDGVDALEIMKQQSPDIVLSDVEMPRMDGYELVKRMRQDTKFKSIPVIMITSRYGEQHREQAFSAGANAFLSKPFEEQLLISTIQAWLKEGSA